MLSLSSPPVLRFLWGLKLLPVPNVAEIAVEAVTHVLSHQKPDQNENEQQLTFQAQEERFASQVDPLQLTSVHLGVLPKPGPWRQRSCVMQHEERLLPHPTKESQLWLGSQKFEESSEIPVTNPAFEEHQP
mmetsp:Transcript_21534/g.46795  ORF Transcript_21534/g.46795 Transcript_21534/m.46795 type:complete len:131 (-) Transcript_21534:476-868(-)